MVIDPGGEAEKVIDMLNILDAKLKYIYFHIPAKVLLSITEGVLSFDTH